MLAPAPTPTRRKPKITAAEFVALAARYELAGYPKYRTLERLKGLQRGERMAYYIGDNLDTDIAISGTAIREREGVAPNYATLLRVVKDSAQLLAKRGKIKLTRMPSRVDTVYGLVPVTRYMAEGL